MPPARLSLDRNVVCLAFQCNLSDDEIAAVANYVTARFGSKAAQDVAEPRKQAPQ